MPSILMKIWQRVPGQTNAARLMWLWHLIAIILLWQILDDLKVPKVFESDVFTPKPNKFSEIIAMGLWRGGLIHIGVSALILLTVRWWGREGVATAEMRLPAPQSRGWWFWPVLGLVMLAALFVRWPRMGQSYWGDEGWALRFYGHGKYEPVKGDDMQGPLKFVPVRWKDVIWDDQTGGNHYLFSALQKLTMDTWRSVKGLPADAFDETISRLPLLVGGLASIIAIALFLSWLGRPNAGLLAALYFALHPWHIRYSTEARGYILMLLFFIFTVWALMSALRSGSWRSWVLFGIAELLAIYSWKIAVLPFAVINVGTVLWLLLRKDKTAPIAARLRTILRLLVVNLSAGALFTFIVMPCTLQSPRALERLKHTGKPMNGKWLDNSLSGLLVGTPWHRDATDNPTEHPVREALRKAPITVGLGLLSAVGLLVGGATVLFRARPEQATMWLLVIASAVVGVCAFKWVMRIEWIFWYSFFTILPLAVFTGLGLDAWLSSSARHWGVASHPTRKALAAGLMVIALLVPASAFSVSQPQIRLMASQPYESNRESFQLTRGKHEPWGFTGESKVITCYLWRHIELYDPRADLKVRDAARLRERIAEADAMGGQLYFVVGMRGFFREFNKDVQSMLDDPTLFEKVATLWAEEDIHIKEIYRYRGKTTVPQ
jgi:hypothetical protein